MMPGGLYTPTACLAGQITRRVGNAINKVTPCRTWLYLATPNIHRGSWVYKPCCCRPEPPSSFFPLPSSPVVV